MFCKICGASAGFFGSVDFNKNCEARRGVVLPPSGTAVAYYRCENCALVFTPDLDAWETADFAAKIYNDDYVLIDSDVVERRPRQNAQLISDLLLDKSIGMLDYGSYAGRMGELLKARGIAVDSWDPYAQADIVPREYRFISSFEVLEHTVDPIGTAARMVGHLVGDGAILFSTYVLDFDPDVSVEHWYISPRNGHVTIYSRKALALLFARFGMTLHHYSRGLHLAYRSIPAWLSNGPITWQVVPDEVMHGPGPGPGPGDARAG